MKSELEKKIAVDYEAKTGRKLTRPRAVDEMSGAAKVVKVEICGGYIEFENWDDYRTWKNQK